MSLRLLIITATITSMLFAPVSLATAQFQVPSTVQLPTFGVSIDADGVLTARMFAEPGGRLFAERALAARVTLDGDVLESSELRKVSLRRLEQAIQRRLAEDKPLDDTMLKLAGLQRIQYLFVYPESNDIVLAGPAEGWIEDSSGRAVGISTGRPVVLLEDLITALRMYAPDRRADMWVGCTIDPTADGLRKLAEFQRTIPSSVSRREQRAVGAYVANGARDSLGMATVRVFGIPPQTNMAQVLVEADYRMKLIGIGLEPPPVDMTTFIGASRSARHQTLQRWWFTPNYECVRVTEDGLAMEMVGQGVQLLSEEYNIGENGALRQRDAEPSRAARLYTLAFTRKYEQIAAMSPVYAQLRNMIDLLITSAYIHRVDAYDSAGWTPTTLFDEDQISVETELQPLRAPCAVNAVWKGDRLLAPAGGGVSIRPIDAFTDENLLADEKATLSTKHKDLNTLPADETTWYWD